jgi:hypothetical protein
MCDAHLFYYNFYKEKGNKSTASCHFEEYLRFYKLLAQSADRQLIAEERPRFRVEQIVKSNEVFIAQNQVLHE